MEPTRSSEVPGPSVEDGTTDIDAEEDRDLQLQILEAALARRLGYVNDVITLSSMDSMGHGGGEGRGEHAGVSPEEADKKIKKKKKKDKKKAAEAASEHTSQDTVDDEVANTTPLAFRLFSAMPSARPTGQHASEEMEVDPTTPGMSYVRLMSPAAVYAGPGKGPIRDLTEEDPQITEARRQQIEDVAIDAAWLFETAKKEHWNTSIRPLSRKHRHFPLKKTDSAHARKEPFPAMGIVYIPKDERATKLSDIARTPDAKAPTPASTGKRKKKIKAEIRPYPVPGKKRVIDRSKKFTKNPKKRKSKKRRMHERMGTAKG